MEDRNSPKPAICFRESADKEWERCEVGTSALLKGSCSYTKSDLVSKQTGAVMFSPSDIDSDGHVSPEHSDHISSSIYEQSSKAEEGDILFTKTASIGKIGYAESLPGKATVNPQILLLTPCSGTDSYFMFLSMRQPSFMEEVRSIAGGSCIPTISQEEIRKLSFCRPDCEEQSRIGELFRELDGLIVSTQRRCEDLSNVKKALLEKMFPKEGSNVPEIRFRGFTDPWEQRKLGDYLVVSSEKNTKNIYDKSDVLSVSGDKGIVNQIEFQGKSFAGNSVSNYGIVHTNDIVYTKSPLKSNPYGIIKTNRGKNGIVSTLYAIYNPKKNTCSNFVQYYFEQDARVNNYLHPLVNKGAKNDMKVSNENALKGEVCFPKYEEQKKISTLFIKLDDLITLHQRKCEQLRHVRDALMEKMLV